MKLLTFQEIPAIKERDCNVSQEKQNDLKIENYNIVRKLLKETPQRTRKSS